MRTKLAQCLVVCALISAIGGHWIVLQSLAWVGMAVTYSQDSTFKEALVKTFDGQHPCSLCKAVAEGKSTEKKRALLKVETKLDLLVNTACIILAGGRPIPVISAPLGAMADPLHLPPTPPPRAA